MAVLETKVLPLIKTSDDWFILSIRGEQHVPGYDPKEVGAGMSEATYRREVEGDWSATTGKLVYPEFGPIHIAQKPLPFDLHLPLIVGVDPGGSPWSGTPAACISQLASSGVWHIFPELSADADETVGIYDFGLRLKRHLHDEFAAPNGLNVDDLHIYWFGDPAGNNRPNASMAQSRGKEIQSCYEVLRDGERTVVGHDEDTGEEIAEVTRPGFGWNIIAGEVSLAKRMEILRNRLNTNVKGMASILFDPECTLLISGLQGSYSYHQRSDGRYELDPPKNHVSHVINALEYSASRLSWCVPHGEWEVEQGYAASMWNEGGGISTGVGRRGGYD